LTVALDNLPDGVIDCARSAARGALPMPVAWKEILDAFEFISSDPAFGNSAFIDRETGTIHWRSEWGGEFEPLPDDIDDGTKYVGLPNPRDLDLGRPLAMRFAADELNEHDDEIAAIFSRKGPYRRLKDFLARVGALKCWYAYENEAKVKALRE
jgi:hypothetical protein